MKAILIDSERQEIKDVDYDGDYKNICKMIKCDIFTIALILENEDSICVDDEGLLKDEAYLFKFEGYSSPLAGLGLILGTDSEGESISVKSSLEDIKNKVKFLGKHKIEEGMRGFVIIPLD